MSEYIQTIVRDIDRLEPFPHAAVEVLELAFNDADPAEIVAVLERDPGLTLKTLRLANSTRYAPRIPVDSIAEAVRRLGSKLIASLALTSGAASYFMGYGVGTAESNRLLWRECMTIASFARFISEYLGFAGKDLAYTVGLLQNVGHIVLDRFVEQELDAIHRYREASMDPLKAERAVLGCDHAQIAARIATRWGLPPSLVVGLRWHHDPHAAGGESYLCTIVNAAEGLAYEELAGDCTSLLLPAKLEVYSSLGLDAATIAELKSAVRDELDQLPMAA